MPPRWLLCYVALIATIALVALIATIALVIAGISSGPSVEARCGSCIQNLPQAGEL
jgi:hypothetical protein